MNYSLVDGPVHCVLRLLLYLSCLLSKLLFLGERDDVILVHRLALPVDLDLLEHLVKFRIAAFDVVSRRVTRKVDALVGVFRLLLVFFPGFFGKFLLVLDEIQPLLRGSNFVNGSWHAIPFYWERRLL